MTEDLHSPRLISFGVFEVDLKAGELRKAGMKLKLTGQPFQVLSILLEHAGDVVTREELQTRLWPDTFVDIDRSLNAAINKIREALGDSANNPHLIETLPRRGYRFIAPIAVPHEVGVSTVDLSRHDEMVAGVFPWLRNKRLGAFFLGGTVVATIFLVLWLRYPPSPKVTRYVQVTNDSAAKIASLCCTVLVNDGSMLYFSEWPTTDSLVVQVSVVGGEPATLTTPLKNVSVLDISHDRTQLLVRSQEGSALENPLWALPLSGGSARRLGNLLVTDANWSPDGQTIVYSNQQGLYLAKADGSESQRLATLNGIVTRPRWSPRGNVIRFTEHEISSGLETLWEVSADGSNLHPLFPKSNERRDDCCGAWTSDGNYFVFQSTRNGAMNIWALRENGRLFRDTKAEATRLTDGPLNYLAPSPGPDEKRIFVIGVKQRGELMRYDYRSGQFVTYLSGISAEGLDFSKDGQWVVYVSYPDGTLWRSQLDGSRRLQLSNPPMRAGLPHLSPDGKRIAFSGSRLGGAWKIYLVAPEGGNPEQLIAGGGSELDPSWSPDGKSLAFAESLWSRLPSIHLVNLETRQVSKLRGSEGLFSPRWSPDGRFIIALSRDSLSLMLFDWTTQEWKELIHGQFVAYPVWSRDGKSVYFCNSMEKGTPFYRLRIGNHTLERVISSDFSRGLAWGQFGWWTGLTLDESPLLLRDTSIQEVYALDL
jgi:Tol biopolymer transport system component/DNA-binding winged helix-turn-helix (wHTH) protein